MSDLTPYSVQWANHPNPNPPTMDPRTILDCNIEGQAWLYNTHNESTEWLTYQGEPVEVVR